MKSKNKFLALHLMMLLSVQTAYGQNVSDDIVLNSGEQAPFSGVLTSESRYRAYVTALEQAPLMECTYKYEGASQITIFLLGLVGGFAGAYLIK